MRNQLRSRSMLLKRRRLRGQKYILPSFRWQHRARVRGARRVLLAGTRRIWSSAPEGFDVVVGRSGGGAAHAVARACGPRRVREPRVTRPLEGLHHLPFGARVAGDSRRLSGVIMIAGHCCRPLRGLAASSFVMGERACDLPGLARSLPGLARSLPGLAVPRFCY